MKKFLSQFRINIILYIFSKTANCTCHMSYWLLQLFWSLKNLLVLISTNSTWNHVIACINGLQTLFCSLDISQSCNILFIMLSEKSWKYGLKKKNKTLPLLFVYPTTASGTQQLENKSKPEDNVRHCMWWRKRWRSLRLWKVCFLSISSWSSFLHNKFYFFVYVQAPTGRNENCTHVIVK